VKSNPFNGVIGNIVDQRSRGWWIGTDMKTLNVIHFLHIRFLKMFSTTIIEKSTATSDKKNDKS
jgi:hypothetical protein